MDEKWMRQALALARQGRGSTSPNPLVGAIIVKNQKIIGAGYHQKAGTPHAEIHALKRAGANAVGGTMYVTLEPCCHYGKTPPCTQAIIKAGIKKVVVATVDPNPLVSGQGIKQLQEAGIQVITGILADQARRLNEVFFKYVTTGMPFCILKMAMTLDGKIATTTGDTRWISGSEARRVTHQLRSHCDAILVGINTVLNDDPQLTTRLDKGKGRDPLRIILDSKLRIPQEAKVCTLLSSAPTMVATTANHDPEKRRMLANKGVEVLVVDDRKGRVDLNSLMRILANKGITSVLIEGGSTVAAEAMEAGIIDKLYWFIAPKIIGGSKAPTPIGGKGQAKLSNAWKFDIVAARSCGQDLLMVLYPGKAGVRKCSPV